MAEDPRRKPVSLVPAEPILISPTVNINGTSAQSLIDDFMVVVAACVTLDRALAAAAPHGRDYQTAPDGDYRIAAVQHRKRREIVTFLREDYMNMALEVQRQRELRQHRDEANGGSNFAPSRSSDEERP